MNAKIVIALALAAVFVLPGCLGNSIVIERSGGGSINESKSIDCGTSGTVTSSFGGGSSIEVTVTDGDDRLIYGKGGSSGGWEGGAQKISGLPGSWTLNVKGSYLGNVEVTLSC